MGRPCTCSCGGGIVTIVDPVDPKDPDPPIDPVDPPVLASGSGPWKVYRAGPTTPGGSVGGSEFIHAFETEPTVSAFNSKFVVAWEGSQDHHDAQDFAMWMAKSGGGEVIVNHRNNQSASISGLLASLSGTPYHASHSSVGSYFIQGIGYRIYSNGHFQEDGWNYDALDGNVRSIHALDDRSFISSWTSQTESTYVDWYSMGSNQQGQIGRLGVANAEQGNSQESWIPGLVDLPVTGPSRPWDGTYAFWLNGGAFRGRFSGNDIAENVDEESESNEYIYSFGATGPAGHIHGLYDTQVSNLPYGISPAQALALAVCDPDVWENELFYGSNWLDIHLGFYLTGGGTTGFGCGQFGQEIGSHKTGLRWKLQHKLPEEAWPIYPADTVFATNMCWGVPETIYCEAGDVLGSEKIMTNYPPDSTNRDPFTDGLFHWRGNRWMHFVDDMLPSFEPGAVGQTYSYDKNHGVPFRRLLKRIDAGETVMSGLMGSDGVFTFGLDEDGSSLGRGEHYKVLTRRHVVWTHPHTSFCPHSFTFQHETVNGSDSNYWMEDRAIASGHSLSTWVDHFDDDGNLILEPRTMMMGSGRQVMTYLNGCVSDHWPIGSGYANHLSHPSGIAKMFITPMDAGLIYIQYNDEEPNYTNTSGVPASGNWYFTPPVFS